MRRNKFLIPIIIICICVLIESLLSAFPYFAYVAGRKGDNRSFLTDCTEIISDNNSTCSFQFDATNVNSISFTINCGEQSFYSDLSVYAADEASSEAYREILSKRIGIDMLSNQKTIYISPNYKVSGILLEFSDTGNTFEISDVNINPQFVFKMNYARLIVIAAIALIIYFIKEYKGFFKSFSFVNVAVITVVLCIFGSTAFSFVCASSDGAEMIEYEKGMDVSRLNPYIQQFDAFEKGQLNIDVEPDPALLEVDNPYDPYERSNISVLWDRAYKDGKYYSYFGTAPIFTAYYPFYFVTGKLPADSTVMAFFAVIVSIFLPLAVMLLSKLINSNISPWFASMTAFGALGASMVYIIQRGYMPFYYIASISAMAFGAATIFWGIFAYISRKKPLKILSFILSGISFALCIHSRLNMAFSIGIVIAAAIIAYFVKSVKIKNIRESVIEIFAFGVPVGIGGILAMLYNYARFSNPFDFGTAYQLTVADTSSYSLSLSGIFPMLYQYFIRPFEISSAFPFLSLKLDKISDIGRYVYNDSNIGIFAMPFMLAILLSAVVLNSKSVSKQRKIILSASLASMLLTAFADICLGGVIFRYTADISLLGAITSAGIIFQIYSICIIENKTETKRIIVNSASALCGTNVIVTMLSMLTANDNLVDYLPCIFEYFRSFVVFWK